MPTGFLRRPVTGCALAGLFAAMLSIAAPALCDEVEQVRGPVTDLPLPRFVSIRADSANARRGPGLNHRVDWEFVRRNLPVQVTAEYGNWRRVRDIDGMGGWIHHSLLSGTRTGIVIGPMTVPLRARPEDDARVRALAEPGSVVRIEECEQAWCAVSAAGFEGWVLKPSLWGVQPAEEFD